MKSVVSYKNRGIWGSSDWRGNASGYLIKDLIEHFKVKSFVDVCEGSGTSREVCQELGINYYGFDLHNGFDFTTNYVLNNLPNHVDLVFSHPPYHNMIEYSGTVWGDEKHRADISNCVSVDEFLEKSQMMLLNQREATKRGGIYCTLIGDHRAKSLGFKSYQADYIQMMPKSELLSIVVKVQNNALSFYKSYSGNFVPIMHEYLIIWKKKDACMFSIAWEVGANAKKLIASTWKNAIRIALVKLDGRAKLSEIYQEVEKIGEHLIKNNKNWKAKVRQVLQRHFESVERGVWGVSV